MDQLKIISIKIIDHSLWESFSGETKIGFARNRIELSRRIGQYSVQNSNDLLVKIRKWINDNVQGLVYEDYDCGFYFELASDLTAFKIYWSGDSPQ